METLVKLSKMNNPNIVKLYDMSYNNYPKS